MKSWETIDQYLPIVHKALFGAVLMVMLHFVAQTKNYYLSHLALSCPALSACFHYLIGIEKGPQSLQTTLIFGLFALIPFIAYLLMLYFAVSRFNIHLSIGLSFAVWIASAMILAVYWRSI